MIKSLWGCPQVNDDSQWDTLFARVKNEGYTGVEMIGLNYLSKGLVDVLRKYELQLICQIHVAGGYLDESNGGSYVYCSTRDVSAHVESFRKQVAQALSVNPVMINCHSGHDSWSIEMAVQYFEACLAIEEELLKKHSSQTSDDVVIVHETHRQRLMFSPYQTRDLLSHPSLHNLKITADLSHWCCVCERVFDKNDPRDDWWEEVLMLVSRHAHYIHCRIGHAEGPQIFDPRDEQWNEEKKAHFLWWATIWAEQSARGLKYTYCTPEHGPHPYQYYSDRTPSRLLAGPDQVVKETDKDDILWAINDYVKEEVQRHYVNCDKLLN